MTGHRETDGAAVATDAPTCLLCGRPLRDPVSRALGFGPRCAERLEGLLRARIHKARIPPPARAGAGQLALDLDEDDEWAEPCADTDPDDWDDWDDDLPRIPPDLGGQGLTSQQLMTMTDIPLTGSYL